MIDICVGKIKHTYAVVKTTAPAAYDGFGSFAFDHEGDGQRWVLVEIEHLAWQLARYQSGMYRVERVDATRVQSTVEEILWSRIVTTDLGEPC